MRFLKKILTRLFNFKSPFGSKIFGHWPIFAFFILSVVFFYPVLLQKKDALPTDALVGAHVPWTELKWEEYPAGIPIKNQEITDSFSQFYPWRSLVGEFWRDGKVPLWNSYMFSGTPFLATWHSAALYPLNAVYLFFNNSVSWNALVFLQIFLAGFFMYLFLETLGLRKEGSLLGAIVFAFSGYMIAWLEFVTGGHAGLWLPLLLLVEVKLVNSGRKIWLIPISIIYFFIFTAGDFQVPLYITFTYILFGLHFVFRSDENKISKMKNSLLVLAGLLFGVLFSAVQLIPTVELFMQSVRVSDSYIREYYFGLMHWEKIVNFIWPDFFGNVVTRNYWGKFGYHEYLSFCGVVALVFVAYSLLKKKMKYEAFFWVLFLTSLLFLFPTPLAFLPFKFKAPGLGSSSASRIIFLVNFCIATLASFGFSKWLKDQAKVVLKIIFYYLVITAGVALGLSQAIYLIESGSGILTSEILMKLKVSLRNIIPSILTFISFGSLLVLWRLVIARTRDKKLVSHFNKLLPLAIIAIATAELLRFAWKNTPFSPREFLFPATQITQFLQNDDDTFRIAGGIPLNLFMPFQISSVEGYDPIFPYLNSQWFSMVNWGHTGSHSGRYGQIHYYDSKLINYGNVKYVVDYKKNVHGGISERGDFARGVDPPRYVPVFSEGRISVFENTQSLPRAWLTGNVKIIDESSGVFEELNKLKDTDSKLVVIDKSPRIKIANFDETKTQVNNFKQDFNMVEMDVVTNNNAMLFLSETFYPGWHAYVDGDEAEVFRANYFYQAIPISSGAHQVSFIYEPTSFKIGKWVSIITAFCLFTLFVYEKKSKKSK